MPSAEALVALRLLRHEGATVSETTPADLDALLARWPRWETEASHERELRLGVYTLLMELGVERVVDAGCRLLTMLRRRA